MTIVASILIGAAVLTIIGAVLFGIGQTFRRLSTPRSAPGASPRPRATGRAARPFGGLPTLSDPVGPLGNPALDADLSSNAESEREIYGE